MIFNLYPNNLYKYRQLDDNSRLLLSSNIIYFPSSSKFNDPFDCSIPFRLDLGTRDQVIQYYYQHYKEEQPLQKDSILRKLAKDDYKQKRHKNPVLIKQFNEQVIDTQRYKHGIFSLTPSYDSLLMWSHYANSHKGFCIGFNVNGLLSFTAEDLHKKKGLSIALFKVLYSSEYPIINSFALEQTELPSITTKSDVWSYEHEYRLILLNKANHEVELPKGIIKRVVLGCQISSEDKKDIINILKNRNDAVHLYEAKLSENKYGLDFEYINYK